MTDEELKALVAGLAVAQRETDERLTRTEEMIKGIDEKLQRIELMSNDINTVQNHDDAAEALFFHRFLKKDSYLDFFRCDPFELSQDFFFYSQAKDNCLGSIYFDDVAKNATKRYGEIREQYDLLMTNDNAIGIVEVKYKAQINDLDILDRKMKHFKLLFPMYESFKQYGGIAMFHVNEDVRCEALARGYFVLQRSGDLVHSERAEVLAVL